MKKFKKVKRAPRLRDTLTRGIRKAESRISDFGLRIADWGLGIGRRVRFEAKGARSIFTSPRRNCRAFTLIELIGVMAIIGILSAVVLPPLISKIEDANTTKEDANLEEIARALVAGIKATGTIPNPTTPNFTPGSWTAIALNYTTLGQTNLATVLPSYNDRQIILSANLANYIISNGSYSNTANGWPNPLPSDLKIYILASSKNGLPLQANIPVADIANWNKVFDAATGTVTVSNSVFGAANVTQGEFLHVKALDLRSLFCRVDLEDLRSPATAVINRPGTDYPSVSSINASNISLQVYANVVSNLESVAIVSGAGKNLWTNTAGPAAKTYTINITNISTNGTVDLTFPSAPNIAVGTNATSIMTAQDLVFYLLKGTSLNLSGNSTVINQDSKFQYSNGTWRQLY